jgi:hypothetical protein
MEPLAGSPEQLRQQNDAVQCREISARARRTMDEITNFAFAAGVLHTRSEQQAGSVLTH